MWDMGENVSSPGKDDSGGRGLTWRLMVRFKGIRVSGDKDRSAPSSLGRRDACQLSPYLEGSLTPLSMLSSVGEFSMYSSHGGEVICVST